MFNRHPQQLTRLPLLWSALAVIIVSTLMTTGCGNRDDAASAERLVIYCGRGRALVEPIIEQFRDQTGIDVQVKYGSTAQLAVTILEEGRHSPADLFWAQDAGTLGRLMQHDRLLPLDATLRELVEPRYAHPQGHWIATSGRARVLAYDSTQLTADDLPNSVFDLTDPAWRGRVGWAPTNASFQAFITAMRYAHGEERTRQWLIDMKNNQPRAYANNASIVAGIAAREVPVGLTNHYYILRAQDQDPNHPVKIATFESGDIGNLLLVAGVGMIDTAKNQPAAERFIRYLLASQTAAMLRESDNFEFGITRDTTEEDQTQLELAPDIPLNALDDLDATLTLLRETGLL